MARYLQPLDLTMAGNKCDECGTKINRLKTPYKFKHGNHTHAFCDPP
jgi:hypothetical protein